MTATSPLVASMLSQYGAMTSDALRRHLPSGTPSRYLYRLLADYPQRGGKMMRPSLCIATARAFGASAEDALCTAVSIELMHNAILIHDDIEDGSAERRGKPTLHVMHGVPLAINAGDTLSLMSLQPLIDNRRTIGPRLAARVLEEAMRMSRETAEGQAMELGWRKENSVGLDASDYLTMVLKKTCWLATIFPTRVGALIGTGDGIDLDPFIRFGFFLGTAFQIQDDVLNLSENERYGKEQNGDLWEGKRTLMLIRLFRTAAPEERTALAAILSRPREMRTADEVRWIRRLMDRYGCIEHARGVAHGLAGAALHEFASIYAGLPESRDKRFIEELTTWVFERTE